MLTKPWVLLYYREVAVTEATWPLKSDYWQKFALKGLLGLWGRGRPPRLWVQVTFCGVLREWVVSKEANPYLAQPWNWETLRRLLLKQ